MTETIVDDVDLVRATLAHNVRAHEPMARLRDSATAWTTRPAKTSPRRWRRKWQSLLQTDAGLSLRFRKCHLLQELSEEAASEHLGPE